MDNDYFCTADVPCAASILFDFKKYTCYHKQGSKLKKLHCVRFGICLQ